MASLIDLRRRIKSVQNIQEITKAMKTVATARFKKSQRQVMESRPFWHNSPGLAEKVVFWAQMQHHPLLEKRKENKIEGVVISSDKGLCGSFNSNLLEKSLSFFQEKKQSSDVNLLILGRKGVNFYQKQSFPLDRVYYDRIEKMTFQDLKQISRYLLDLYIQHKRDAVYVIYNEFKSILSPKITVAPLIPLNPPEKTNQKGVYPDWDPSVSLFVDSFLPQYIDTQLYHFFSESLAAEQAARMMAMENASKNAEDLISDLTLELNKIRQASITKELLEIMTAVEALGSK
ncbi:ATP synthase F1 subunit gamma [bacterium]|nr:ATP synthase F1 subunit gamma [bacterium]